MPQARCGAHGIRLPFHAIRGPGKVFEITFPVCDPWCNALRVLHPTNRDAALPMAISPGRLMPVTLETR